MVYQLTKTSVGVTGQVKWDIILNNHAASEVHIVPIHKNVSYVYRRRKDTTNYTHLQNVKSLYKETESTFFQPVINPILNTGYPVRNSGEWLDTREFAYDMHLGRIDYKRYNKQFEFFCPIWVDSISDMEKLSFHLVIEGMTGQVLYDQAIDIDSHANGSKTFKEYLLEYAKDVNLNDDIAYIDLDKNNSWVKGVNVEKGMLQTKNIPTLTYNILSMERPVLDTDNFILSQFSDNKLICTQLLNLNFVFNLNDILPVTLYQQFIGSKLNMYVDVYCDGVKVELKDLYSNYDFMPRYNAESKSMTDINCLDYLEDNRSIQHIHTNKLIQSTFHWSLKSNNDYIFNLYNGFSPVCGDTVDVLGIYADTPVISDTEVDNKHNPYSWCAINDIGDISVAAEDEVDGLPVGLRLEYRVKNLPIEKMTRVSLRTDNEYVWLRSLLIDNTKLQKLLDSIEDKQIDSIAITHVVYTKNSSENISWNKIFTSGYNKYKLGETDTYLVTTNDLSDCRVFIIHNSEFPEAISLVKVRENGLGIGSVSAIIKSLLNCAIQPRVIYINKSIYGEPVDIPQLSTYTKKDIREIDYFKYLKDVYLFRYDGALLPTFIDPRGTGKWYNNIYTVKQYERQINYVKEGVKSDKGMDLFNSYMFTKFLPIYPSIGYDSQKTAKLNIDSFYMTEGYEGEVSWYKKNALIYLPEQFTLHGENEEITEEFIKEQIVKHLESLVKDSSIKLNAFILPLYDYKYTTEYVNETTIDTYTYDIIVYLK